MSDVGLLCYWAGANLTALHAAQAVAEEYPILESVNHELVTYTPAAWVCLFEARFSLRVQHLRQRFPQGLAHYSNCSPCKRGPVSRQ